MSIVCVRSFAVSLDGFAAGLDQSLEQPLGARGPELMEPSARASSPPQSDSPSPSTISRMASYEVAEHVPGERAVHVLLRKRG
jgi:hypothetical protein